MPAPVKRPPAAPGTFKAVPKAAAAAGGEDWDEF
jgi:hypothetical protein